MKKNLSIWFTMICMIVMPVALKAQEITYKHIKCRTYTHEAGSSYLDETWYYDGLGRQLQSIQDKFTPGGNGQITIREKDLRGKLSAQWLPAWYGNKAIPGYTQPSSVKTQAMSVNNDDNPYIRYEYESSPLGRLTAVYEAGKEWHTRKLGKKQSYFTNVAGNDSLNCVIYILRELNFITVVPVKGADYATGQLSVVREEDEAGRVTFTFTNTEDQTLLTRRTWLESGRRVNADTYYVYDDFGRLRAVLPPLAIDRNASMEAIQQYAYLYSYDSRGRCITKKLPGCDPVFYVYDAADRQIFSQDGEQRKKGEWSFTIPDILGRTVLTGICKNMILFNGEDPYPDTVFSAHWSKSNNTYKGYTLDGGSLTAPVVLTVHYYDNYEFMGLNGIPSYTDTHFKPETVSGYGTQYTGGYQGMQTGTWMARLEGASATGSLYRVMYYDEQGRVIQMKANNHLTGGIDKEYMAYNFTGQLVKRRLVHTATGKTTQTEVYSYTYDHAGRLTKSTHQLNSGAVQTLVENTYDERGRVKTTTPGAQTGLRSTYTYNIRSWLTNTTSSHYVERLTYHYDGNLSENKWTMWGKTRTYNYAYDQLSRLTSATYTGDGAFGTSYTYDKHGNILTLKRNGFLTASTHGWIDNLTFSYAGNQLMNVTDTGPNATYNATADFKDYTKGTGVEYHFNANGAMTKDLNKGISSIAYNWLYLPRTLDMKNPVAEARTTYTYSAQGTLLSKLQQWNAAPSSSATAGSAVNASALNQSLRTDYAGNKVYENGTLKRILIDGGYIEGTTYHFYVKDRLGNNVVVGTSSGSIVQRQVYYPFGSPLADRAVAEQNKQPYKFGDKEFDIRNGLNLYDFHARQHDPATGRFMAVDPSAESYYSTSPYAYCENDPINYMDPTGMDPISTIELVQLQEVEIIGKKVADPVTGFWSTLSYFLAGRTHTYETTLIHPHNGNELKLAITYNVDREGKITGVAPMGGTAPLPSTSGISLVQLIKNGKQIWSSTKKLSSLRNAITHWNKHGKEFPQYKSAKEYVEGTHNFLHNSPAGTVTKIRPNGEVIKYHAPSNTFGVMDANGIPKTMFKPNDGMNYFLKQ